jgi:hypothetical protein
MPDLDNVPMTDPIGAGLRSVGVQLLDPVCVFLHQSELTYSGTRLRAYSYRLMQVHKGHVKREKSLIEV